MPDPKMGASIGDWQSYIQKKVQERGFADETAAQILLLLVEEIGELAKAIRPLDGIKVDANSERHEVRHELADVFWYVCNLSNALGIDLDEAIRLKEVKNNQRIWK